jgi:hypothetical protein
MPAISRNLDSNAWGRLLELLAPRFDRQDGDGLLADATAGLGLASDQSELSQTLAVLDELARLEGLVGVVASFAKSRLLMRATN